LKSPSLPLKRFESGFLYLILLGKALVHTQPEVIQIIHQRVMGKKTSEIEVLGNYKMCMKVIQEYALGLTSE